MKRILTAAITAAFILAGCSGSIDSAEPAVEAAVIGSIPSAEIIVSTQSSASETSTPYEETTEPVLSADTEATTQKQEILPYFESAELAEISFYPSEEAVRRIGRFIEYNDVYYLSYTCSAVSFMMTGNKLEAAMTSNANSYSEKKQCWIGVLINGELAKRFKLNAGENTYSLYEGEMLENAEISIVKLTENPMASSGILTITANAKMISPTPEKALTIEFIGDSITCGYGNEASEHSDGFNTAQENGLETYGYYTAQALEAEYSLVCYSGMGIISDCTTRTGVKEDYLLMPDIYDYSDVNFEMSRGIKPFTEWNFGEGSDIVVINLGTNDYTYTGKNESLQEEFCTAYYKFIEQVRKSNPHAEIICTMGILGSGLFGQIETAVQAYSKDTGDEHIHTMEFEKQRPEDGYGGDYHPTVKTQQRAAEQLTEYIQVLLN